MLNKQLKTLIDFAGLSDTAVAVQVAKAYLLDCFGLEVKTEDLTELNGYLPSVSKHAAVVGVIWKGAVHPLREGYRDYLAVATKENKDKQSYFVLNYSIDQEAIPGSDATTEVPVSFANIASRALNPCFNNAKDGNDSTILPAFQFARLNSLTKDGDYKVVEIQKLNKGVLAVSDSFTVYFNDTQSVLVKKGTVLTVKEGEAYVDNAGVLEKVASGGGVTCLEIPPQIGWTKIFTGVGEITGTDYTFIIAESGDQYWTPLSVTKILEAAGTRDIGKFSVTVTGLREKDEKKYPVTTVKPAK